MYKDGALNFTHPDFRGRFDDTSFEHDLSEVAFDALPHKRIMLIVALGLSLGLWAAIWFGVWALFCNRLI